VGPWEQEWIEVMAAYVKSVDPLHLLTVGEEGFFGASTPLYLFANPGSWAGLEAGASTCPKPFSSLKSPNVSHKTCSRHAKSGQV